MFILQTTITTMKSVSSHNFPNFSSITIQSPPPLINYPLRRKQAFQCLAVHAEPESEPEAEPESGKPGRRRRRGSSIKKKGDGEDNEKSSSTSFPTTIPRKPRRGRRSEAVAVEDYIRNRLDQTFASLRQQNPDLFDSQRNNLIKQRVYEERDEDGDEDEEEEESEDEDEESDDEGRRRRRKKKMVVEEERENWPVDADIGWGIRASEYFEQHPIKNVVSEDGFVIDWEGEMEDALVKEINCLEWESIAFHPSPLIVLVFERYRNASDNWKTLKELEKAAHVYWNAKDRLPPRVRLSLWHSVSGFIVTSFIFFMSIYWRYELAFLVKLMINVVNSLG